MLPCRDQGEWQQPQRRSSNGAAVSVEVPSPQPAKRRSVLDRLGPRLGGEEPQQQQPQREQQRESAAPKRLGRGGSSERDDRQQAAKRTTGGRAVRFRWSVT